MKKIIASALISCSILCGSCKSDDNSEINGQNTSFDVTAVTITNADGQSAKKGEEINLKITVKNTGNSTGTAVIRPQISSSRFADYSKVALDSVTKSIAAGETAEVNLKAGPFIFDEEQGKHFALGRGEYYVNAISINNTSDTQFEGAVFNIGPSNAVLVPVIFDPAYLGKVNTTMGIQSYLTTAFTRKVELYDNEEYTAYPGGMDEMMDMHQIFYPIATTNPTQDPAEGGLCEKAVALGGKTWACATIGKGLWELR